MQLTAIAFLFLLSFNYAEAQEEAQEEYKKLLKKYSEATTAISELSSPKLSCLVEFSKPASCNLSEASDEVINGNSERIPKYWAQLQVGLDIAREEFPNISSANIGLVDIGVDESVIDNLPANRRAGEITKTALTNSHGNGPLRALFSPNYGAAISSKLVSLNGLPFHEFTKFEYITDRDSTQYVDILSISAPLDDYVGAKEKAKSLAQNKIIVISSGNDHPAKSTNDFFDDKVLVGATDINGKIARYSQEAKGLNIFAPAGNLSNVESLDGTESYRFTGTSFSTPLVSGSIANIVGLLGRTKEKVLTVNEIKEVLSKTSIKTVASNCVPSIGVLNSYKMLKVAERLKNLWPYNRGQIDKNPSLYDFSIDSKKFYDEAKNIIEKPDCSNFTKGLKLLRKAFLLTPENVEVRKTLYSLLIKNGNKSMAEFYKPLDSKNTDCRQKENIQK